MGEFKHTIKIGGKDNASPALKKVQKSSKDLTGSIAKLTIIFGALGMAAIAMGRAAARSLRVVANAFKQVTGAAIEQEKAEKKVANVLKSTGHAAGLTAKEVHKMAASFQSVTTFGDEAVLGMQSVLLTFTKVKAAKGIFEEASAAVLNIAAHMGTDLNAAALQVGKALNDPIVGVSALAETGVSFTKTQKETIKSMVEMGDVAGAQALMLAELNVEFGEAAKGMRDTFGGALEVLSNSWGDLLEKMGDFIIKDPVVKKAIETTTGVIDNFTGAIGDSTEEQDKWHRAIRRVVTISLPNFIDGLAELIKALTGTGGIRQSIKEAEISINFFADEANVSIRKVVVAAYKAQNAFDDLFGSVDPSRVSLLARAQEEYSFAVGMQIGNVARLGTELKKMRGADTMVAAMFHSIAQSLREMEWAHLGTELGEDLANGVAGGAEATLTEGMLLQLKEQLEGWEAEGAEFGAPVGAALGDSISNALLDKSVAWAEQFEGFTTSIKQMMMDAFLEPIIGAESMFAELGAAIIKPFADFGKQVGKVLFEPLITGILNFFGVKTIAQKAAAAQEAATQAALAGGIAKAHGIAVATMMPGLSAAATASLIATFGASGSAAGALPGLLAAGMAEGKIAAASLVLAAEGGRFTSPTFAMIGEAGAEVVIPENRPGRAASLLTDLADRKPGLFGGGGNAPLVAVTLNTFGDSPESLAEQLADALNDRLGGLIA